MLRGVLLLLFLATLRLCAQSFDVASLKPVTLTPGNYRANLGSARHGEVTLTNCTLSDCLRFAYTITNDAQIAGPDWIRSKEVRFDITAKAAPETPLPQLLLMLQTLLTERFKLELHREQRNLAVMALTVGRNGPKFHEATEGSDGSGNRFWPGSIVSNRVTMTVLATILSRFLREPVLDMTGLKRAYELKLEWTPEARPGPPDSPAEAAAPSDGASIFAAVQEQLGLRLERHKGPLEVIVIDRAERVPIEN